MMTTTTQKSVHSGDIPQSSMHQTMMHPSHCGDNDRSPRNRLRSRRRDRGVFAYSRLDGLLVLVATAQLIILVYGVMSCGVVHWGVSVALAVLSVFLMCTNFQCIAHNFLHNPFFRSARLNQAFGIFNSLLIGGAQTLYRFHHLHHHKHNNDLPDPETGLTKDFTSTWRYGRPPEHEENIVTYSLLGYFRSDFGMLLVEARRKGMLTSVICEFGALAAMIVAMAVLNFWGVIMFYVPVWFFGNVAAMAENYLEHHGATPGNRQTDSVSCYNWLYNLIWFNNGYHQEHHYKPQVHWTVVPEVKELLPPTSERRVVRGAHWFNFGSRRDQRSA